MDLPFAACCVYFKKIVLSDWILAGFGAAMASAFRTASEIKSDPIFEVSDPKYTAT